MTFQEVLEYCKAKSINDALNPTEDSVWRSLCRAYSRKFFTPLRQVEYLDPEHVILSVFEDQMDGMDPVEKVEDLLDQIYTMQDPNYKRQKEENMEEFIKVAEEKEQKRLRELRPKKEESPKQTSGGVDFSNMKNES